MKNIARWLDHYSKRLCCILLAVCLVCFACMGLVESNFGKVSRHKDSYSLAELAEQIQENNTTYGKDVEVSFTPAANTRITIMTMKPSNASDTTPVPTVIACHGSNDTMSSYLISCTEIARRGYGVVLFDGEGHGESTLTLGPNTHNSAGFEAVVEYAMSLGWVDENNIGITGHSWGSRQVNAVVNWMNTNTSNHIKAALYCGSGRGLDMDPQESKIYLGAIAGVYDEHLNNMTGNSSYDFSSQRNARVQCDWVWPEFSTDEVDPSWLAGRGGSAPIDFGSDAEVQMEVWYTSHGIEPYDPASELNVDPGSLVFFNPNVTHEGTVYSPEGVACIISFFQATLGTPNGVKFLPGSNQITQISKYFSFIALISLFLMFFPLFNVLMNTEFFKKLKKGVCDDNDPALPSWHTAKGQIQYWGINLLTLAISLSLFFLICKGDTGDSMYFPASTQYPVTDVNKFLLWMMAVGICNTLLYCVINGVQEWHARRTGKEACGMLTSVLKGSTFMDVFRSVMFAGIMMTAFWGMLRIGMDVFHTTIRFSLLPNWYLPVPMRPYPYARLFLLPRYLPFFIIAWLPTTIGIAGNRYRGISESVQSVINGIFNILPMVIFIVYEYVGFLTEKHNVTDYDIYWLGSQVKSFIIPLFFITLLTRYIYRKTKNVWIASAVNILFITIMPLSSLIMYTDVVIA